MTLVKVFKLDSLKSFRAAERYKAKLENAGYSVTLRTSGFDGVRIAAKPKPYGGMRFPKPRTHLMKKRR